MSRQYENPPIIEALCEFQFEPDTPWDIVMPGLIYDELRNLFPLREPEMLLRPRNYSGPKVQYSDAVSFLREDERVAVLVGPNILSVSHLAPYSSWEEFVPSIKRSFEVYKDVVEPVQLQSVELRYINDLTVPTGQSELSEYLNIRPFVEHSLPQEYKSFITGIQVPYEDNRDSLKVEVQGYGDVGSNSLRVTLDLDYLLVRADDVGVKGVFDWLEGAHSHVEDAFEACLTDNMRRIFGEDR